MHRRSLLILGFLVLFAGGAAPARAEEALNLGGRRELFVDRLLAGDLAGDASLRLQAPQPREVVLRLDRPWEGVYSAYFTIFRDGDLFRMYYRGMPEAKHDFDTEVTCYAESRDGIRWEKPSLGLHTVRGTAENNVILARHRACHNFAPFRDANPACAPAERYKAVGGTGEPGLLALVSEDGVHWRDLLPEPVITAGAFDSQNVAFWSETEGCYVCYFRVFRDGVRWVARSTSADFRKWTEPVDLDWGGLPPEHLYTNQLTPYFRAPHLYLGMPTRFLPGRRALTDEQARALGTSTAFDFRNDSTDILLVSSRGGGGAFDRSFREAFIRPGRDPRNWTSRANYAAHGIVPTEDGDLSLYVNHNVGYPTSHLRRYTLRPDGFVSVHAGFAGGELRTVPVRFAGAGLTLNCSTSAAGGLRVEIQDAASGEALPGYALDDCPEIFGDELERRVVWSGGGDVSALAGRAVRLRFALRDADLYALQFVP